MSVIIAFSERRQDQIVRRLQTSGIEVLPEGGIRLPAGAELSDLVAIASDLKTLRGLGSDVPLVTGRLRQV